MNRRCRGLTLIEVMVTIAIIAVLAGVAFPAMSEFIDRQRLVGQTQAIADMAQTARSEVIKRRANTTLGGDRRISMTVNPGTNWSVGLANGGVACTTEATCVLNKDSLDADGVKSKQWLAKSNAGSCPNCTMTAPAAQVRFEFNYQGLVSNQGAQETVTLRSPQGRQLSVRISPLGRITLCSPGGTVTGYQACV